MKKNEQIRRYLNKGYFIEKYDLGYKNWKPFPTHVNFVHLSIDTLLL